MPAKSGRRGRGRPNGTSPIVTSPQPATAGSAATPPAASMTSSGPGQRGRHPLSANTATSTAAAIPTEGR